MARIGSMDLYIKQVNYVADIFYTSSNGFYIKVPESLTGILESLTWGVARELGATFKPKSRSMTGVGDWIISAADEQTVRAKFTNFVNEVIKITKKLEPVIIIEYRSDRYSYVLPETKDSSCDISINYFYAIRCTIGRSVTYERPDGRRLTLYNNHRNLTIIPDKPEYREKIETLVKTLKKGDEILSELFSDAEKTVSALNSAAPFLLPSK